MQPDIFVPTTRRDVQKKSSHCYAKEIWEAKKKWKLLTYLYDVSAYQVITLIPSYIIRTLI